MLVIRFYLEINCYLCYIILQTYICGLSSYWFVVGSITTGCIIVLSVNSKLFLLSGFQFQCPLWDCEVEINCYFLYYIILQTYIGGLSSYWFVVGSITTGMYYCNISKQQVIFVIYHDHLLYTVYLVHPQLQLLYPTILVYTPCNSTVQVFSWQTVTSNVLLMFVGYNWLSQDTNIFCPILSYHICIGH